MHRTTWLVYALLLLSPACGRSEVELGDELSDVIAASGGSGGFSGSGGLGGVDANGGVGATGGVGGLGGSGGLGGGEFGGSGGFGGNGGSAGACEPPPDVPDACWIQHPGWYAAEVQLDAWWPATDMFDPGRDFIVVRMLIKIDDDCTPGGSARATARVCDLSTPTMTSDATCTAAQIGIERSAWTMTTMPSLRGTAEPSTDGQMHLRLLPDPSTSLVVDAEPASGVEYMSSLDSGLCSNGQPYTLQGPRVGTPIASDLRLEVRLMLDTQMRFEDDCANAHSDGDNHGAFDWNVTACRVDPTTLDPNDPFESRHLSMRYECYPGETRFLTENLPRFGIFPTGAGFEHVTLPSGWTFIGRDLPRHLSAGPITRMHWIDDVRGAPTCEEALSALSP